MEQFLTQFEYLSRYVLSAVAVFILLRCVISLFRLRPRKEVMATLTNLADDSEIEIENWETSVGRSRTCDISLKNYGTVSRFMRFWRSAKRVGSSLTRNPKRAYT